MASGLIRIVRHAASLTAFFVSGLAAAQTPPPVADAARRSAEVLQSLAPRLHISGTVLVARGDTVLLHQGVGQASLEWGIAQAPGVRHLLASVSKQFTAAAVLRLVDQGRLGLDDPVRRHLPELPAAWQAVTVRQLLAHTAGIPNHTEGDAFEQGLARAWTPRELLASFSARPLDFEPGTQFRYSNSGYIVAGVLIEQLAGMPYAAFLQREFFTPLGMADSGVAHSDAITHRLASGYRLGPPTVPGGPPGLLPARLMHMSVPYAAGALYGSTGDLLAWQRALYGGRVLSAGSLEQMTTVQRGSYALGLGISGSGPTLTYGHSGGIFGFSTYLLYQPAQQLTVAVLANVEGVQAERLARQLADAASGRRVVLAHERRSARIEPAQLAALAGAYERPGQNGTFWVLQREGTLYARQAGEPWRRLQPESALEFYAPEIDGDLRFVPGDDGRPRALVLPGSGDETPWLRVDKALPSLRATPIYLRGSANDWKPVDRLADSATGELAVELRWPAGRHEFKLASEDWQAVDLGHDGSATPLSGGGQVALASVGRNLVLTLERPSACRFVLMTDDVLQPRLRVSCLPT